MRDRPQRGIPKRKKDLDFKRAFDLLDHKGTGTLSEEAMDTFMTSLGTPLHWRVFATADADRDSLTLAEFERLMEGYISAYPRFGLSEKLVELLEDVETEQRLPCKVRPHTLAKGGRRKLGRGEGWDGGPCCGRKEGGLGLQEYGVFNGSFDSVGVEHSPSPCAAAGYSTTEQPCRWMRA